MRLLEELKAHGDLFNENVLKDLLTPLNQYYEHNNNYLRDQEISYHSVRDTTIHQAREEDSKECDFKIIKMVQTRNHFDRAWCFGFTKRRRGRNFEWKGAFAGTYETVFQHLKNFVTNNNRQTKEKTNLQLVLPQALGKMHIMAYTELKDIASEIYENLLDQREWDDFDGVNGLMGHISGLTYVARNKYLNSDIAQLDICPLKNEDGDFLIYNTGLLDKYTNFVLLQCKLLEVVSPKHNEKYLTVESISLVSRLAPSLMDQAFPVLQLCSRDRFFFPSNRIFLDHTARLDHMFTERWDRLDADGQDYSPDVLFKSLQSSVDLALKMNQIDSNYIIPYYNLKQSDVLYLIPLYVGSVALSKPVCAVSIGLTKDGVWAPITILTLSMARSNARLLNKLKNTWLLS